MQHRHRRLGFAMTAALGVEVAAAAGLVIAGLLSWEWDERLWGRTDGGGVTLQVAIALAVLSLVLAWVVRSYQVRTAARTVALLAVAVIAIGAVATVWQAELGGRGAGGILAAVAAVLVAVGAVSWLVGLAQLKKLFPFGLDARSSGFGNLPAVRRAKWIGGPTGAVGGIAVVAGALLVAPGMVTTEDASTASALALTGEPPAAGGDPAWELEVPATATSAAWATTGGVIIAEEQGVRAVDPSDGQTRWHWRDEAYQRAAGVVTDGGDTVVLALTYDGEETGRDRVVALDAATGEVRWDRHDDDLVAAMATFAVEPEDADWFVAIQQEASAEGAAGPPTLRAVGSDDGDTRWEAAADEGCSLTGLEPAAGTVATVQECTGDDPEAAEDPTAAGSCLVTSLDPTDGSPAWSWPADGSGPDSAASCQVTPTPELVFVTYQADDQPAAVALDPATGAEVWTDDENPDGLSNPAVVGDAVVGTEFVEDGAGGGEGTLVIRDAADGEVREQTPLPAGQPIDVVPTRPGFAAISQFRPETTEVLLLEVDVAEATVSSETPVASGPPGTTIQRLSVGVAPETLAVETLVAAGEQGSEEYTLLIEGW